MKSAEQINEFLKSLEDKYLLNNDLKEGRADQKGIVEKNFQKINKTLDEYLGKPSGLGHDS